MHEAYNAVLPVGPFHRRSALRPAVDFVTLISSDLQILAAPEETQLMPPKPSAKLKLAASIRPPPKPPKRKPERQKGNPKNLKSKPSSPASQPPHPPGRRYLPPTQIPSRYSSHNQLLPRLFLGSLTFAASSSDPTPRCLPPSSTLRCTPHSSIIQLSRRLVPRSPKQRSLTSSHTLWTRGRLPPRLLPLSATMESERHCRSRHYSPITCR